MAVAVRHTVRITCMMCRVPEERVLRPGRQSASHTEIVSVGYFDDSYLLLVAIVNVRNLYRYKWLGYGLLVLDVATKRSCSGGMHTVFVKSGQQASSICPCINGCAVALFGYSVRPAKCFCMI